MKASSQESRMADRAGESLGIRPSRTCGSSLGMGSDRCSNFIARSRNCSGVSIYPEDRRLTGLGTAVRAVARAAKPVAVVEDHRLVADGAVRRLRLGFGSQD